MTLDELTNYCTAFRTFAELIECSLESGYCPSLYPHVEETVADREYNFRRWELIQEFDGWMERNGYPQRAFERLRSKAKNWAAFQRS